MSFGMQYFSYINPTVLEVVDIYLFLWTWKKPQKKKVIKTFFLFPTFSIFKNGMDKWYSSWNRQLCVHSLVMCQARNIARSKVWNPKRTVSFIKFLRSGPKVMLLYFDISNFTFWSVTHIIGSASWPKIKNFQYHLSGVVEDLLGINFLPMGK